MPTAQRFVVLGGAVAFAMLAAVQCEDPAARARARAQAEIAEASREFARLTAAATHPGQETFEKRAGALEALAGSLRGIDASEGGQDQAVALLAAAVQRELATMSLARARVLESDVRQQEWVMHSLANAVRLATAIAEGRETIDLEQPRSLLVDYEAAAESQRSKFSRQMAELDGPIDVLRRENYDDQSEVDRVTSEVTELRREASQLGPADGFEKFEEAVALERQIDRFENRMAHREIDLDYELLPEHKLAEAKATHAQEMIEAIEQTQRQLDEFLASSQQDAQATRQAAREWAAVLEQEVQTLDGMVAELRQTYQKALEQVNAGLSHARKAGGRGDTADSAKLANARLAMLGGSVHMARARTLSGLEILLGEVAAVPGLEGGAALRERLEQVRADAGDAVEQAKESYRQAKETIASINTREVKRTLMHLSARIDAALASLSGEPVDLTLTLPGGDGSAEPAGGGDRSGGGDGGGYTSHEALWAALVRAEQEPDLGIYDSYHASTPDGREVIQLDQRMTRAMLPIVEAMNDAFGTADAVTAAMSGGADVEAGSLVRADGSEAIYSVPSMAGPQEFRLIEIDGRWYVDCDAMVPMVKPSMPMGRQLVQKLEDDGEAFAQRIRDGEFTDADTAGQAFMAFIVSAMSPPGGGAPGGPGG